ncbi:hypothetical protein WA026_016888 [Henosepilachna vigintioctopunctata]|uniref:Uncharacterized protein n=1 Tax=Henosepilachna vigintioctopunctata TaxID=420089 RepID=A0AAW1U2L3_9CUCU
MLTFFLPRRPMSNIVCSDTVQRNVLVPLWDFPIFLEDTGVPGLDNKGLPRRPLDGDSVNDGRPLFCGRHFPTLHRCSDIACLNANRNM